MNQIVEDHCHLDEGGDIRLNPCGDGHELGRLQLCLNVLHFLVNDKPEKSGYKRETRL